MKNLMKLLLCCCLLLSTRAMDGVSCPNKVSGSVTCEGKGLQGVVVTDGIDVVQTDAKGRYELPVNRGARFVYLSSPAGYLAPLVGSHVGFYQRLKEGNNQYDFVLTKNPKNDFNHVVIAQADVQVASEEQLGLYQKYVDKVRPFVKAFANGRDAFVLDCGDLVGNSPGLYPRFLEVSAGLEMPAYRMVGNHDMELEGRSFEHSYRTYEDYFGPIYYSFNRGKAHYIVLDNCFYINRDYRYIGYIDERTLQWMEKDLALVPKDHVLFVAMHIPASSTKDIKFNALLPDETNNVKSLFEMVKDYDTHIITGHTHTNGNVVFNDRLMEHNTAAVCAGFWRSPLCSDGTPQGFGLYEVNGNKVTWRFKTVDHPLDFQFKAYAPGASKEYPNEIIANVWNWDELWKVEWYENGKRMGEMEHCTGLDPGAVEAFADREKMEAAWVDAFPTEHLFKALPKNKQARIEVVVTDRFGNVYKQVVKK